MSNGYLIKIPGSQYWQARFLNEKSVEVQRSTKTTNRKEADKCLQAWSFASSLKRQTGLCAHRVRRVIDEVAKLLGGDMAPIVTVDEYAKAFVMTAQSAMECLTFRNRRRALQLFRDHLGDRSGMPLEDVLKSDITGFRDALLAQGSEPGTVKQRVEVLHTFFANAATDGIIKHNPCSGVVVRVPKAKGKAKLKKRKALSFAEGIRLIDHGSVEEVVSIVVGLDLGARIGDALAVRTDKINLSEGRVTYWIEKIDEWHTVDFFPPTVAFLTEYIHLHRPPSDSPLLIPDIGVVAGPDEDQKKRQSQTAFAGQKMGALFDRAEVGEKFTRESGRNESTGRFHCLRITNDNFLKMAGISTEWVMWRLGQSSFEVNKKYDRFNADNANEAMNAKLGIANASPKVNGQKKAADGSMTFDEAMSIINYAREKLVALRTGRTQVAPAPQIMMFD